MWTVLVDFFPWFLAGSTLVVVVYLLVMGSRAATLERRLEGLSGAVASSRGSQGRVLVSNRMEEWLARRARKEEKKLDLKQRLEHAGFYSGTARWVFLASRVLLALIPLAIGFFAGRMGLVKPNVGLLCGALTGLAGTLAPSFWLDYMRNRRQTKIRRALPDAMDVMAVCLEGGLSLPASLARVARELATAHPLLALEFHIVERQIQMGRTTGEALRDMGRRLFLEEVRNLASVVIHAEKTGASLSDALQVFADTLRLRRQQKAEEMAQKASVKLLFPTLFFIFPGIFIVILGPAAIQIYEVIVRGVMQR